MFEWIDSLSYVRYNVHIKEASRMLNTNATNFRKNMFSLLEQTAKYNQPVQITTKDGNAVMISEEDYNGLMETMYLNSVPGLVDEIKAAAAEPLEECVPEDEVEW